MLPSIFARLLSAVLLLLGGPLGAQLVRQPNSTLTLPVDLPSASGYTTVNALGSLTFSSPMCTAFPAGETNRLYVAQRGGLVRVVNNLSGTPTAATFLDLATHLASVGVNTPLSTSGENGLLSIVFHPDYNQNGYFYLYFSISVPGQPVNTYHQRLARFQAIGVPGSYNAATSADPASMTPLLTIYDERDNHNGGDLHFGADGYLYISLGDEGGGGDQFNNARFINKDFWGQMLRLDVDNRPENLAPNAHSQPASAAYPSAIHAGAYRVPADNPFIGYTSWHGLAIVANTVRTEIYATGLRNPFRFSIDPPTQRIFLGDVGQNLYEEVNIIEKGGDYGWSWREGLHDFVGEPAPTSPPAGYENFRKDPIYEYDDTDDGNGNDAVLFGTSVVGGIIYRGNQLPELQGKLIFGDVYGGGGIIAALTETSPGVWTGQRLTTRAQIVDYGVDPRDGEPLLCSLLGTIWKIQRTFGGGTAPSSTLSGTGAFSNLATLTPNTGIVPYEPNVAFWSDYAIKSRWFSIKNTTDTVGFSTDGNWTFPTGMVWVKHFDIELERGNPATRRKLETRFLVKTSTDIYGLSYRWNNIGSGTQTNATLVGDSGETMAIPGSNPAQTWRFPGRSECRTCHTQAGGFALSFNTRQLNRTYTYGLQTPNQISALGLAGYFTTPPADVHTLPAFARADDTSQSLEWRVRSYLAVNCVQCHQPGGGAQGNWDARPTIPTDLAGLINGLLVNNGGDLDARWCVPGDAPVFGQVTHSMVLKRLRGDGAQRMPPLGTNERDLSAEALLTAWVTQELPTRQDFVQWQTSQFGSPGAIGAGATDDPDGDGENNQTEFLRRTAPTIPTLPFSPVTAVVGSNLQLSFPQIPGRSLLIETSTDLETWSLWNVPGNTPDVPANGATRTLVAPIDAVQRFFRARISAP